MKATTSRTLFTLAGSTVLGMVAVGFALAQTPTSLPPAVAPSAMVRPVTKPAEQGIHWRDLKPAQKQALKPLEDDWASIDAARKQKWLQIAAGFPKMAPAEQARVQGRMAEWAQLTPEQRGAARMNFQEAARVPEPDRQARWEAYQALPPDRKLEFAARAVPPPASAAMRRAEVRAAEHAASAREPVLTKSNLVPNPGLAARPQAISPTVVRATPGATTSTMSRLPAPPSHQQTGLPKIAATPGFVDRQTLLPQRGPQGAAVRPGSAASNAVVRQP
jgi:Protein of unknown function (DUF3106)